MKKSLSLLLALLMIASVASISAGALNDASIVPYDVVSEPQPSPVRAFMLKVYDQLFGWLPSWIGRCILGGWIWGWPPPVEETPPAGYVKVTGVAFDGATSFYIQQGKTQQLAWAVTPSDANNKGVVFSSSDVNVATVSPNGLVTAKADGVATITVTTTDTLADQNYRDTVTVTVLPV